jgi:hypothetical protein
MSKTIKNTLLFLSKITFGLIILTAISCQTVKPYQRIYLNDSAMKMGYNKESSFERYAQMIREGANGASGKNSGGCGCN